MTTRTKPPTPADEQRHSLFEIDQYIERFVFVPRDFVFLQALRDSAEAGLPKINVSANEGKLLYLLARIAGARRVLEIGLLGGYSTMWLAQAIGPQGRLVTLEVDEKCIGVARKNLERAGLISRVEIRQHGDAQVLLKRMVDGGGSSPFDLVFIDADKPSYPAYLDYAVKLTHPGSLILADNVIRDGKVAQVVENDKLVQGIQEFNKKLSVHPKLETIVVTVTREGVDNGLAIARVKGLILTKSDWRARTLRRGTTSALDGRTRIVRQAMIKAVSLAHRARGLVRPRAPTRRLGP